MAGGTAGGEQRPPNTYVSALLILDPILHSKSLFTRYDINKGTLFCFPKAVYCFPTRCHCVKLKQQQFDRPHRESEDLLPPARPAGPRDGQNRRHCERSLCVTLGLLTRGFVGSSAEYTRRTLVGRQFLLLSRVTYGESRYHALPNLAITPSHPPGCAAER